MRFQIRPMRADDLSAVYGVQCAAHAETYHEPLEALRSHFSCGQEACLVAETEAGLSAYVLAHPWRGVVPRLHRLAERPAGGDYLFIHDLAVAPVLRGSGAAASLLSEALGVAQRASLPSVRLVSLAAATPFWQKHGFSIVAGARLPDDYGEAVFMERSV